jgi:hypothetical protein
MSELALTLLRLGFLVLLWVGVFYTLSVLRRDLRAPRDAGPKPRPVVGPVAPQKSRRSRTGGKPSKLVVTAGPLAGTAIPLGSTPITIGRAPDSTLVVDDDYASRNHARIYPADDQWVVEDLQSANGTWLNRNRINRPTTLPVGVPLRIGVSEMQVRK